ncbi:hypothetical protein [Ruegeria hyattellae]|uniref:hypothetical protein n=1 Tax=Ruegeria hyattellae TaxID=3233337 RepID=UPI00355B4209
MEHPDCGPYAYKFQLCPNAPDRFASKYSAHAQAIDAFAHSSQLTLPNPVFLDAYNQASLMQYVIGRPVSEH